MKFSRVGDCLPRTFRGGQSETPPEEGTDEKLKRRRRRTYATRSDVTKSFCLEVLKDVGEEVLLDRGELTMKSARNSRESATTSYAIGKRSTIRTARGPCEPSPLFKVCRNVRMMDDMNAHWHAVQVRSKRRRSRTTTLIVLAYFYIVFVFFW